MDSGPGRRWRTSVRWCRRWCPDVRGYDGAVQCPIIPAERRYPAGLCAAFQRPRGPKSGGGSRPTAAGIGRSSCVGAGRRAPLLARFRQGFERLSDRLLQRQRPPFGPGFAIAAASSCARAAATSRSYVARIDGAIGVLVASRTASAAPNSRAAWSAPAGCPSAAAPARPVPPGARGTTCIAPHRAVELHTLHIRVPRLRGLPLRRCHARQAQQTRRPPPGGPPTPGSVRAPRRTGGCGLLRPLRPRHVRQPFQVERNELVVVGLARDRQPLGIHRRGRLVVTVVQRDAPQAA